MCLPFYLRYVVNAAREAKSSDPTVEQRLIYVSVCKVVASRIMNNLNEPSVCSQWVPTRIHGSCIRGKAIYF